MELSELFINDTITRDKIIEEIMSDFIGKTVPRSNMTIKPYSYTITQGATDSSFLYEDSNTYYFGSVGGSIFVGDGTSTYDVVDFKCKGSERKNPFTQNTFTTFANIMTISGKKLSANTSLEEIPYYRPSILFQKIVITQGDGSTVQSPLQFIGFMIKIRV